MTFIQTFTGRRVDPLNLRPEDICIEDIAHALARVNRFTGHTREAISVAQHSFYVSIHCEPQDALDGLLHDASEAYLCDIPRPLKRRPEFAFYRHAEARAMTAIAHAFGLRMAERRSAVAGILYAEFYAQPPSVTVADRRVLATEVRDLMPGRIDDWHLHGLDAEPYERKIRGWSAEGAEETFMTRFRQLTARIA